MDFCPNSNVPNNQRNFQSSFSIYFNFSYLAVHIEIRLDVQHQLFWICQLWISGPCCKTILASDSFFVFKGLCWGKMDKNWLAVKNGAPLIFQLNSQNPARGHWDFLHSRWIDGASFEIAQHFSSRLISVISMINAICLVICIRFEPCASIG